MEELIREATLDDLPRIVEMGRRFLKDTKYDKHLSENPEQMKKVAELLILNKTLLISERDGKLVGMLGFVVHSHFISGDLMAGEVFWWMEPEYRGRGLRLMREMERRGRLAGAMYSQMVAPNEELANLYRRRKYEFVEATYQRSL
jgi:hypothetical protein